MLRSTGSDETTEETEGSPMLEQSPPALLPDEPEYLRAAIAAAQQGRSEGGIPIGAALVVGGAVLGTGYNKRVQLGSPIRHGETDCLENVGRLPAAVFAGATMVTTLSPCDMCSGAILLYRIPRVIIGENRTFLGAEELLRSRGVQVVVIDDQTCISMMTEFIAAEPALWNEDIGLVD
jgi:creatinine deaminase